MSTAGWIITVVSLAVTFAGIGFLLSRRRSRRQAAPQRTRSGGSRRDREQ